MNGKSEVRGAFDCFEQILCCSLGSKKWFSQVKSPTRPSVFTITAKYPHSGAHTLSQILYGGETKGDDTCLGPYCSV